MFLRHDRFMSSFVTVTCLILLTPALSSNIVASFISQSKLYNNQQSQKRRTSVIQDALPSDNSKSLTPSSHTTDVIVIGSGLAGLTCASLLSASSVATTVLESHDTCGGCAHGWTRRGFHFESGPSLYSGFSIDESPNPLKGVFQIIGEEPEWITYDRWGTVLPGNYKSFRLFLFVY